MNTTSYLNPDERILYTLRELYRSYGYLFYKVSKFEEYDLYLENKDFLDTRQLLTFTDTDGRLHGPKTGHHSIAKNSKPDGGMQKVCYTENVYRAPNHGGFREIPQTGLECIGEIDLYAMSEVVMLAVRSLETISAQSVLDLSHLGVLAGLLADCPRSVTADLLAAIGAKNAHEVAALCSDAGIPQETCRAAGADPHCRPAPEALPQVQALPLPRGKPSGAGELAHFRAAGPAGCRPAGNLDFSIVSAMEYYNGVFFRGYVDGIPAAVVSGGRYDKLMQKMGRGCGAIGFAVYLAQLERFGRQTSV
ncbi:MAG: ATP phosphoribosyltransferase regulatory subunit [Oscillospiraceae bacterium]